MVPAHWVKGMTVDEIAEQCGVSFDLAYVPHNHLQKGDLRTYDLCCTGVPANAIVAIGSHGCVKLLQERSHFEQGLAYVVDRLKPKAIVVYGTAPQSVFSKYKEAGIEILQFDSDYMVAHRKAVSA